MKKIIIILVLFLMVFNLYAENLNEYAFWAKETPEIYEAIKTYSINEWDGNADLVIKEINFQSYFMFLSLQVVNNNPDNQEIQEYIKMVISDIINDDWIIDWAIVWKELLIIEKGE